MKLEIDSGTKWFLATVILVLILGGVCSAMFWDDLAGTGANQRESLSTTVRNVMLMIGALLALPLAIWRGWVAERQVKATNDSVNASHDTIANQRFQAAAQMLGHDLSAVRLGAIHTLAQLSREDRERYYVQSARLLASFVRQPRMGEQTDTTRVRRGDGRNVREDVSATLDYIGSWTPEDIDFEMNQGFKIDLHGKNFDRWDLSGLNLARVLLHDASFSGATLKGTNLTRADLSDCYFGGAFVGGAILRCTRLSRTNFSRWRIGDKGEYVAWRRETRAPGEVVGLVQAQLDEALDDQDNPPRLRDVRDAETGELLSWHDVPPEQL